MIKEDEILCAVKSFRDLGASDNQIKEVLVKNHRLSFAEAEKFLYLKKFTVILANNV